MTLNPLIRDNNLAGLASFCLSKKGVTVAVTVEELKQEFIKRYGEGDVKPTLPEVVEFKPAKRGRPVSLGKHNVFTLRLSIKDGRALSKLVGKKGRNRSDVIRNLIREAANALGT
jgi:hypothetical protein